MGGNALNVAAQLTLAGHTAGYWGAVGTDPLADVIRMAMNRIGLSTRGVVTMSGSTAVTDIAVLPDGERVFEREEFGVTAEFFPSERHLDAIAECQWIHIGMQPRASDLRSAIRARNPRAVISQDMSVSSGFDDLDVAFTSGAMLQGIEPREAIRRHLSAGVTTSIVTLGSQGVIGSDGDDFSFLPAKHIDVVDATGAGDSFIAGFIAAMTQGATLPEALESGTRLAATTCGHRGGWRQ
ncbi:PfkB family carbohydrate kinase [Microbacterium aurantiacum]|uniref:Carbohydrate kinase PfkB domain-containing protein n=1 Tax=Microbacterium aurantiacum TaxID=162393 RepID=A0AAJ2HCA7_9MICO|nr:PfkB family carbohydrate kinase [Microbacterium aurantiacum]MDS0244862.1 hypothetical protein [Microbacterium aurantiacum]